MGWRELNARYAHLKETQADRQSANRRDAFRERAAQSRVRGHHT